LASPDEHAELSSKVQVMLDRSTSGKATVTIEVLQFLMEWLKGHTTTSDRLIGEYVKTNGK
jgi:hemerythrin